MAEELNRRTFMKAAAIAAGPAVMAARGANDKVNIGWIGVGTRGYAGLDWLHTAAACTESGLRSLHQCPTRTRRRRRMRTRRRKQRRAAPSSRLERRISPGHLTRASGHRRRFTGPLLEYRFQLRLQPGDAEPSHVQWPLCHSRSASGPRAEIRWNLRR